ncbi:MAG: aldo/keto reductase [Firmicutes bacterium]|nr:aldo/keto reductase [Bacillota bacterium]
MRENTISAPEFNTGKAGFDFASGKSSRRDFIKNTVLTAGLLAAGMTSCSRSPAPVQTPASEKIQTTGAIREKLFEQRPLGKTGINVCSLSAGQCAQPDLLVEAYNAGITSFETARGYMGGNLERIIGKALKSIPRDKVVIITKIECSSQNRLTMIRKTEECLNALGIDTIDVLLAHGVHATSLLSSEVVMQTFTELKKSGKIRFCGVSTHQTKEIGEWMLQNPFYDVLMTAFNYSFPAEASDLLRQLRQKGTGIIGMKSLTFKFDDHKATIPSALKFALSRDFMDTVAVPFSNAENFDANMETVKQKFSQDDEKILAANSKGILQEYYFNPDSQPGRPVQPSSL